MEEEVEDGIGGEEGFGDGEAAVRGVVEGAFEPLGSEGVGGVLGEGDGEPGKATDPFAIDGVPLIGHGGGTDLGGVKGL